MGFTSKQLHSKLERQEVVKGKKWMVGGTRGVLPCPAPAPGSYKESLPTFGNRCVQMVRMWSTGWERREVRGWRKEGKPEAEWRQRRER